MRVLVAAGSAVAIAVGAAALALAQTPVPEVTVALSKTAITVTPQTALAPGPTEFTITAADRRADYGAYIAAVKQGRTAEEVIAAIRRNPDAALEIVDMVASTTIQRGVSRTITGELKAGRPHVVITDAAEQNPANWVVTPLQVAGAPNGATVPRPDAQVQMRDLRFRGAKRLPRNGVVRVTNVGWAPHFAFTFPLRSGARQAAVGRALERNQERALGRLVDFAGGHEITNVLTRGARSDNVVRFPRRGRYVMVCFFDNHHTQGMYRFVRVR